MIVAPSLPPAPAAARRAGSSAALWPTPEQELLLRAALARGDAAISAWRRWRRDHDPVETELDHGSFRLLPLVYRNLAALGYDEAHMPRLKGIHRYWWCSNQNLFHRSAPVVEALEARGIPTLILKGAAIATLHAADAGVRPMADVDVLVPYARVHDAVALLMTSGWRAPEGVLADEIRYRHSTPMVDGEGRGFDLHWHALKEGLHPRSDDGFWSRAVPLELANVRSRGLAPQDALLHTVVHGLRWNEEPSVRWIADAMAILGTDGDGINWDVLLDEARRRDVRLRVFRGLDYLRITMDAPIPDHVLARLSRERPSRFERIEYATLAIRSDPGTRDRLLPSALAIALEYWRVIAGRGAWYAVTEAPGFLRHRLRGRQEAPIRALRKAARVLRLGRRRPPETPSPPWSGGKPPSGGAATDGSP
jgi:hypothetical protein